MANKPMTKRLTMSDVKKTGVITLPKKNVDKEILPMIDADYLHRMHTQYLKFEVDLKNMNDGNTFKLYLSKSTINVYQLQDFYDVVKAYSLKAADEIVFHPKKFDGTLNLEFEIHPNYLPDQEGIEDDQQGIEDGQEGNERDQEGN